MSPRKPARACSHRGCPNLVRDPDRRYCDEHQAEEYKRQDERRGSSAQRGYGAEWREIRDKYLGEHPICERCGFRRAELVHHKLPLKSGGTHRWSNLMACCGGCHEDIHQERGERF